MTVGFRLWRKPIYHCCTSGCNASTFSSGGGSGELRRRGSALPAGDRGPRAHRPVSDPRRRSACRLHPDPTSCRTTPIIQALVDVEEGVAGVDLFLADPEQTGKGLGSKVHRAVRLCDVVFTAPTDAPRASRDPDAENYASLHARSRRRASHAFATSVDPSDDNRLHTLIRDRTLGRAARRPSRRSDAGSAGGRACGPSRCCQNSYCVSGTSLCRAQCFGPCAGRLPHVHPGQRRHPLGRDPRASIRTELRSDATLAAGLGSFPRGRVAKCASDSCPHTCEPVRPGPSAHLPAE